MRIFGTSSMPIYPSVSSNTQQPYADLQQTQSTVQHHFFQRIKWGALDHLGFEVFIW
jgi:hypothetical protein